MGYRSTEACNTSVISFYKLGWVKLWEMTCKQSRGMKYIINEFQFSKSYNETQGVKIVFCIGPYLFDKIWIILKRMKTKDAGQY